MKGHLVIVFLMIFLSFSSIALGDNDSMKIILLIEDKEYLNGTSGNLTVHIFDKAVHVEPDRAPIVEILGQSGCNLTVSRVSPGVYNGTFKATNEDVVDNFIIFRASATMGKTSKADTVFNWDYCIARIPFMGNFTVGMAISNVSDSRIGAGTRITVQAGVTALPEVAFDFHAEYLDPDGGKHSSPIDAIPLSEYPIRPGRYPGKAFEGTFTVPYLPYSATFSLVAHARYGPANRTVSIAVPSNFFFIVYHNISNSETEMAFDIFVGNDSGEPVPNASVKLRCYPDGFVPNGAWTDAGVTNSSGCTRIRLRYENGTRGVHMMGMASALGKTQTFEGTINVPQGEAHLPDGPGFQITSEREPAIIYGQGGAGDFSYDYWAYNDSKAWGNKKIYCYVVSYPYEKWWCRAPPDHLNGAYMLTTDGTGGMTVNSSSWPYGNMMFYFESPTGMNQVGGQANSSHSSIDRLVYSEDIEWLADERGRGWGAGPITKISLLGPDGPFQIWTNGLGYAPCDMVTLCFVKKVYGRVDYLTENSDWRVWTDIPVFLEQNRSYPSSGSCNFTFPKFMPKEIAYCFNIREMESAYGYTFRVDYQWENGSSPVKEPGSEPTDAITITLDTSTMTKLNVTADEEVDASLAPPWLTVDSSTSSHPARPDNGETSVDDFSSLCPIILLGVVVSVAAMLIKHRKYR